MIFRATKPYILIITILLAASLGFGQKRPTSSPNRDTVIFAVEKYDTGESIIEPVAMRRGNSFLPPPSGDEGDEASTKFTANYFKSGARYRMLSGGGEAGWITVKERMEPGCVDLRASVTINTIAEIGNEVMALATDSDSLGQKEISRRAATEEERATIVKMAQRLFRQKGVVASLIKDMKASHLSAVDTNRDTLFELIGTFEIIKDETAYSLFIIAEPEGLSYKTAFNLYKKSSSEADIESERLVDALDLDGDGIMEIVGQHFYYESYDFVIYKKQKGQWQSIYRGGGGGC